VCSICSDTGFVLTTNEQGFEIATKCECYLKDVADRKLRFANIPKLYEKCLLSNFGMKPYKTEESKKLIPNIAIKIKAYLEDIEHQIDNGKGLYLWSAVKGSGKTRMACSIANELRDRYAVKFATSTTILSEIKNSWDDRNQVTESQLLFDLASVDILIIDDFGTETPRDWINERFYQIINERYINKKATIFTSNDKIKDLKYDDRIISRVYQMAYELEFPNEDIRETIAEIELYNLEKRG
jgi:DNA replication protein DnaC